MTLLNVEWSPGGVQHQMHVDEESGDMVIHRMQDVSPILEYNKFLRGLGAEHYKGEDGNMWHYAHVPIAVLEQMIQKFGPEVVLGEDCDDRMIKEIEVNYPWLKVGDFSLA
jgi:hypothetical protein